jgi:peroxiredoxin
LKSIMKVPWGGRHLASLTPVVVSALWISVGGVRADAPADGVGTLRCAYPVFRLTLLRESESGPKPSFVKVSGTNGRAEIAPGRYSVFNWEVEVRDKKGQTWLAAGNMLPRPIEVRAGADTQLPLAMPLQAHLYTIPESQEILFRINYTGSQGERVRDIKVDGVLPPQPLLKIVDPGGKVVQGLAFKPGCCGTGMLTWTAPPALRGRFKAVPDVKMGPFPVEIGGGVDFELADGRLRMPAARIGNPAPDFSLIAADASTVQLSFLRDRPVLLCFLSSSDESRALATALAARTEIAEHAHMLAIFTDPEQTEGTAVDQFRTATHFPGPVLLDQILTATLEYQSAVVPRIWLIGKDGRINYTNADPRSPAERVVSEVVTALATAQPSASGTRAR